MLSIFKGSIEFLRSHPPAYGYCETNETLVKNDIGAYALSNNKLCIVTIIHQHSANYYSRIRSSVLKHSSGPLAEAVGAAVGGASNPNLGHGVVYEIS